MRDIEDGDLVGLQYDPRIADINMPLMHANYAGWFYTPKNPVKMTGFYYMYLPKRMGHLQKRLKRN